MLQMLGCLYQNLSIGEILPCICWLFFSVQEFNFIAEAAAYFTLLLFWLNFYYGIEYGKPIPVFQSFTFAILALMTSILYLIGFSIFCLYEIKTCPMGWYMLRHYLYYWHAPFFVITAIVFLVVTIKLRSKLNELGRFRSRKKTIKVLVFLSILTVFRSAVDVIFEHADMGTRMGYYYWDTWIGFFTYFLLEVFIPSTIFLLILGKIPASSRRAKAAEVRYDSGFISSINI